MSTFGFSTYILVTQKGRTYIPFCRASAFMIEYASRSFYQHHIITAPHAVRPNRFKKLYGNPPTFDSLGDRHMNHKLITLDEEGKSIGTPQPLILSSKLDMIPAVHVASLRIAEEEAQLKELHDEIDKPFFDFTKAVQVDGGGIQEGEKLILEGVDVTEEQSNFHDSGLTMTRRQIEADCRAGVTTHGMGTVLIATTNGAVVPPSFCGGPVFRASNGKCVGVISLPIKTTEGEDWANEDTGVKNPSMNLLDNEAVLNNCGGVGATGCIFTPMAEFLLQLRKLEAI